MPQGLQIFDASGNTILDTNMKTGRVINVLTLTGSTNGSETNSALSTGTAFYMAVFLGGYSTFMPIVSIVGNTISWTWPRTTLGANSYRLIYGVY